MNKWMNWIKFLILSISDTRYIQNDCTFLSVFSSSILFNFFGRSHFFLYDQDILTNSFNIGSSRPIVIWNET